MKLYNNLLSTIYEYVSPNDQREKFAKINRECHEIHREHYNVSMKQFNQQVLVGNLDTVKWILEKNKNFKIETEKDKQEALYNACESGSTEMVKFLLQKEIKPTDAHKSFQSVCKVGNVEILKLLLDNGLNPGFPDSEPLVLACTHGHLKIVKELLNSGKVDPAYSQNCAIRRAYDNRRKEIVDLLLKQQGVDPTDCDNYIKRIAKDRDDKEMLNILDKYEKKIIK